MPIESHLTKHALTALPPLLAGTGAAVVRWKFHPFTFDSEAVFVALVCSFLVSAMFAFSMMINARSDHATSSWIAGLDVIVEPLMVLEVAICTLAMGWMLGTIFAISNFPQAHPPTLRVLMPCAAAALAGVVLHLHLRPTQIQRIWQLADATHGTAKLEAMLHTAQKSNDETTLHAIAKMPRMKPNLLTTLASHSLESIRAEVANNPNTPASILLTLSLDPSADVRRAIAFNNGASVELLRKLLDDSDQSIREKAASRLRELEVPA